jgi:C-terminal processing protease CtpA/Prc
MVIQMSIQYKGNRVKNKLGEMLKILPLRQFTSILFILICINGYSQRKYSPGEIKSEIDTLFTKLEYIHPDLYKYFPKNSIYKQIGDIKTHLMDSITIPDFWFLIAPVVNGLNQGHVEVTPNRDDVTSYEKKLKENGNKIIPIDVIIKDTIIIIKKIFNTNGINSGSVIQSINNIPSKEIIDKMLRYVNGERKEFRLTKIEPFFASQFSFFYPSKDFSLKLVDKKGEKYEIVLKGISDSVIDSFYIEKYFSKPDFSYKTINGSIGFLEINSFHENDKFNPFIDSVFKDLSDTRAKDLIIDIRNNGGGDTRICDELISDLTDKPYKGYKTISVKLTKDIREQFDYFSSYQKDTTIFIDTYNNNVESKKYRYKGNIYVLTSPSTFSSATYFAMIIKDYHFGILVGDETGGLPTGYGDMLSFQLPVTKLNCTVSYKSFIRPSGVVDNRGVIPDYIVKPSIDDLIKGKDIVMDFVLKKINKK